VVIVWVVARKLRLEYEGAIYHVMSRGDRREAIFRDDADRESFLETLAQACEKTGWRAHAWCHASFLSDASRFASFSYSLLARFF